MNSKITLKHRQKLACVYVRQSSLQQVLHNQQSTERQYALREKATQLGWTPGNVQVLDGDLGVSGTQTTGREDFKRLVADVSMGNVGAVFALEASRLARSSADWHRLIELCALSDTILVDEDGVYSPADFNDALLLGMKGTMSAAELHFIRARLLGGRRHKAEKGELRIPIPIGYVYDDQNRIVFEPDVQVREAVALLFRMFREKGSANGVVRAFAEENLLFPRRAGGGIRRGPLQWGPLIVDRVLATLHNPMYAGTYAFGRKRAVQKLDTDGQIVTRLRKMPRDQWMVEIPDHHEAYLTRRHYEENLERLACNHNGPANQEPGAAREGPALLPGLLICGNCGLRLSVYYRTHRPQLYYQCLGRRQSDGSKPRCQKLRGDLADQLVVNRAFELLKPAQLNIALEAYDQLKLRRSGIDRQWQLRLQRAEYESQLAQRRYEQVDPGNRLVAASLEVSWNESLVHLDGVRREATEAQVRPGVSFGEDQRAQILALANDLPKLWQLSSTTAQDKKRILRLLIQDITAEKISEKEFRLHLRWRGGACESLDPSIQGNRLFYPPGFLDRVRQLAAHQNDREIAATLNQEGLVTVTNRPFSKSVIKMIRYYHQIPTCKVKRPDEWTVPDVADYFGVKRHVVYHWIETGLLTARRVGKRTYYWVTLDSPKEEELWEYVRKSGRIREKKSKPSTRQQNKGV